VDGEEAEGVQVELVTVVDDTDALVVSARTGALTTEEMATPGNAAEELRLRASDQNGTFSPASANSATVQSLDPKKDVASPHVSSAQGGPETTTSLALTTLPSTLHA